LIDRYRKPRARLVNQSNFTPPVRSLKGSACYSLFKDPAIRGQASPPPVLRSTFRPKRGRTLRYLPYPVKRGGQVTISVPVRRALGKPERATRAPPREVRVVFRGPRATPAHYSRRRMRVYCCLRVSEKEPSRGRAAVRTSSASVAIQSMRSSHGSRGTSSISCSARHRPTRTARVPAAASSRS
jgi:hypothetical protein